MVLVGESHKLLKPLLAEFGDFNRRARIGFGSQEHQTRKQCHELLIAISVLQLLRLSHLIRKLQVWKNGSM